MYPVWFLNWVKWIPYPILVWCFGGLLFQLLFPFRNLKCVHDISICPCYDKVLAPHAADFLSLKLNRSQSKWDLSFIKIWRAKQYLAFIIAHLCPFGYDIPTPIPWACLERVGDGSGRGMGGGGGGSRCQAKFSTCEILHYWAICACVK